MKRIIVLMALFCAGVASAAAPSSTPPPSLLELRMRIQVAGDGSVSSVTPDAALPDAVRQLLVRRVTQWRFKPVLWQGKPASVTNDWALRAQLVPTTQGGQVLKVVEAQLFDPKQQMVAPRYPESAMRSEVSASFIYAVTQRRNGELVEPRLVWSQGEGGESSWLRTFEEAIHASLADSRLPEVVIDGAAIECMRIVPFDFRMATSDGNAKESPALAEARRIAMEAWEARTPDQCPMPKLETAIAGTIL